MELLKYIYALKPGHKYFSKDFDGEDEWRSDGSYSSEDSEFELQFSEVVKDLPPSLASKLPKRKVRDYDEYDDDEEEAKQEEIVQKNTKKSILRENTVSINVMALIKEMNISIYNRLLCQRSRLRCFQI